jgi:hypothetical protein
MPGLTDGTKMIVHHVTGTLLYTDTHYDTEAVHIKLWDLRDKPAQQPNADSATAAHRWHFVADGQANGGPAYRIESGHSHRALTAGDKANDPVRLHTRTADLEHKQRWHVVPSHGSENRYVIIPAMYVEFALGPDRGQQQNNIPLIPFRIWLRDPAAGQIWHIGDAPN